MGKQDEEREKDLDDYINQEYYVKQKSYIYKENFRKAVRGTLGFQAYHLHMCAKRAIDNFWKAVGLN